MQKYKNEKIKDEDDFQFRLYVRLFQSYFEKIKAPDIKIIQFWNEKLKPFLLKYYPVEKTNLFIKNSDIEFLINEIDKYNKTAINNKNENKKNSSAKDETTYEKPSFNEISQKLNTMLQKSKNPGHLESFSLRKTNSMTNIRAHSQTIASISTSDEDQHPIYKDDSQKHNIINDIVYEDITENININNEAEICKVKDNETNNDNININAESSKNNNLVISSLTEELKNNIENNESTKSKTVVIRVMNQYYKVQEECENENIIHNKNNNIKCIEANLLLKKIVEENFLEKNTLVLDAFLQQCFSFIKKEVFVKKIINCFKYYKKNKTNFNKIQNLIIFLNGLIIRMIEYYNGLPVNDSCLISLKKFYYELINDTLFNLDINNEIIQTTNLSELKNNINNTEILLKTKGNDPKKDKTSRLKKKIMFIECQNNLADIDENDFQNRIPSFQVNKISYNLKDEKEEVTKDTNISYKTKKQGRNDIINKNIDTRKSCILDAKSIWTLELDDESSNYSKKSYKTNKSNLNNNNNFNNNIILDNDSNSRNTILGFCPSEENKQERKQSADSDISFSIDSSNSCSNSNTSNSNSNCSSRPTSRKGSLQVKKKDIKKNKILGDAELIELLSFDKEEDEINLVKNRQIISNEESFLLSLNNILKIIEKPEYKLETFIHIKKHQKFFKDISLKKDKMLLNNENENNNTIKRCLTKNWTARKLGKGAKIEKNMQKGYFCITDWETEDIANSLINNSKKLIYKIQYRELYGAIYLKKTKEITSHNIVENVTKFNQLVSFIVEDVLSYDYPSDRARVIEKWVDVANYCKLHRDYNDCVAIICAMNNYIITGLDLTIKEVKKQTKLLINQLNEFCTCNGNYKNLREEITNLKNDEFYIPYLGIIMKDLAFFEENSKYLINGMINLEKIEKVQKCMDDFFKFKCCEDNTIKPINQLNFFGKLESIKESELEELAGKLEPVFTLSKAQKKTKRFTAIDKKYFMGHVKRQSAFITNTSLMNEMIAQNFV